MIEAIKRLIMALVFYFLGGYTLAVAVCIAMDVAVHDALVQAVAWPYFVYALVLVGLPL